LICTNEELSISEPAVASVVATDVLFLFVERGLWWSQSVILSDLVELIGLGTSNQHNICSDIAERGLSSKDVGRSLRKYLLSDTLWLVPLPHVDILVGHVGEGDKKFFIFGTKSNADILFVLLFKFATGDKLFTLELRVVEIVDAANWGAFSSLSNSEPSFWTSDGHSSDSFGAFNSGDVALSLLLDVVKRNIVTDGITHGLVVNIVQIVVNITFDTCHKLGH
jgi:hypothetical protein